jgi:hypothetical protein
VKLLAVCTRLAWFLMNLEVLMHMIYQRFWSIKILFVSEFEDASDFGELIKV